MNHYQILGLEPGASDDDVKKAYRRLAMKHHPDRGGDEAEFKRIKDAYEAITNKTVEPFNQFQGFNDLNEMFNAGRRSGNQHFHFGSGWPGHVQNPDVNYNIHVTLEEAHSGFTKEVRFAMPGGQQKELQVTFPAGCSSDTKIRYHGEGGTLVANQPPGDLYVRLQILQHPVWTVANQELYATVNISVWDAMFGTSIEIMEIGGTLINVAIPSGSQPNSQLRLKGRGMNIRGMERGNAYLIIKVIIPKLEMDDRNKTIVDIQNKIQ